MRFNRRSARGFTMIEIVVTLAIIVLLFGLATAAMQGVWHARDLEIPMSKVREYAKRARNMAIFEQRPYQVEITPRSVALYSMVGPAESALSSGSPQRGLVERYEWDDEVTMHVRRWNQPEFIEPSRQVWVFERSGLCEPLTVRAQSEHGFVEMTFNPLDAHVENKISEIR
jgi:prepilin-type N-terminal cleavage/methylation domain-containing protein